MAKNLNDIFQAPIRTTLTSEVAQLIHRAIESGLFEAGEQLTESRIAKQLKISRAPVREALHQLEQDGLLTYSPHRGYFLREFNLKDLEEIYLLRIAMEKLAIQLGMERASAKERDALTLIVKEMIQAIESENPDIEQVSELDFQFHKQICSMSHHSRLIDVWESMTDQMELAILSVNRSWPVYDGFVGGHQQILEAILAGDQSRAEGLIERHVLTGLNNFLATVKQDTSDN